MKLNIGFQKWGKEEGLSKTIFLLYYDSAVVLYLSSKEQKKKKKKKNNFILITNSLLKLKFAHTFLSQLIILNRCLE